MWKSCGGGGTFHDHCRQEVLESPWKLRQNTELRSYFSKYFERAFSKICAHDLFAVVPSPGARHIDLLALRQQAYGLRHSSCVSVFTERGKQNHRPSPSPNNSPGPHPHLVLINTMLWARGENIQSLGVRVVKSW